VRPPHFVQASGEATVTAKPDRAEISLGVTTQSGAAQAASAQNAADTTEVLAALNKVIGGSGEIKTTGYSLAPEYQYSNANPPRLTGYRASNTVLVTVDDLSIVGKIVDTATKSGANNINSISFSLRDEQTARIQALSEAAERARANAEAIAKALGVRVVGVLEAEPAEMPVIRPLPMMRSNLISASAESATTPIQTGSLDIRASVTVKLEVQ